MAAQRWWCMALVVAWLSMGSMAEVYIVTVEGDPAVSADLEQAEAASVEAYSQKLQRQHDVLLDRTLESGGYKKLYSYRHIINGMAVDVDAEQAERLRGAPGVLGVVRDWRVRRMTTHTPKFLGLPSEVWPSGGGEQRAGDGVVVGVIDTGIFPQHPSFAAGPGTGACYGPLPHYRGKCEIDAANARSFCNGKIIGAQHFAAAAIAAGSFNPAIHFDSPLDGDGHGTHTAATAAGNYGVAVRMHGYEFGKASGMAPCARIAVYKALYRQFGGFVADVVAAIDQAVEDGVDILNLSVGPNTPPATEKITFLNPFDAALLSAVKAGVFVVQAAGNGGPFPKSIVSFSPWITTVAAGVDDRRYNNSLSLGNGKVLTGVGLAPATPQGQRFTLIAANDAMLNDTEILYTPSDCQSSEVFNRSLIQGNILVCGYSYNFVYGSASIKRVAQTAKNLSAAGFVLAVETVSPGAKFDPVPVRVPGIVITDPDMSEILIQYYNTTTLRDFSGQVTKFGANGAIGNGLKPVFESSAPQVAVYSSRGPDVMDFSYEDVDVLKPDILAPGSLIWAAWTPNGTDEANYIGEGFAMISGTSMAAPHIAGIAALVKQKHPNWSPAAIKSSLQTTSSVIDHAGKPLKAQHLSATGVTTLIEATPFDYGTGAVNPKAALDPGLVFDADFQDYASFLCSIPGIDKNRVENTTRTKCTGEVTAPADLNAASIVLSNLASQRTVTRRVTNVGSVAETYTISSSMAPAASIQINPTVFTLKGGETKFFSVTLSPKSVTGGYVFGQILLKGDKGHMVRMAVAVQPKMAH